MAEPDGSDLPARARALGEAVTTLDRSVQELRESNVALRRRGRQNRALILLTAVGLFLDLSLSGLFVGQHLDQVKNNKRIECQNELRSQTSAIADRDRRNVDSFFAAVVSVQTAAQFHRAYQDYLTVRDADDTARAALGSGKSSTCG